MPLAAGRFSRHATRVAVRGARSTGRHRPCGQLCAGVHLAGSKFGRRTTRLALLCAVSAAQVAIGLVAGSLRAAVQLAGGRSGRHATRISVCTVCNTDHYQPYG